MRLRALVLGLVVALGAPVSGWAQPAQPAAEADSEALKKEAQEAFLQGREAFKAGDHRGALTLFQKSQSRYPRPGTLFNLATCEQELGMVASALKHFQEFIPQVQQGDDRIPDATARVAALGPRVPRLRIELAPGSPVSTAVSLDGSPLTAASLGADLPLDPGDHEIMVTVPGRSGQSYKVKLAEGARISKRVEAGPEEPRAGGQPLPPPDVVPPDEGSAPGGGMRKVGFIVGGVGLAGLGVGAVTGILAISKKNEVDKLCPTAACTEEGVETEDAGKTLATVSTVAFIVGIAGTGLGTFLVVWNGGGDPKKGSAIIGPSVMPGGMGLTALGSF